MKSRVVVPNLPKGPARKFTAITDSPQGSNATTTLLWLQNSSTHRIFTSWMATL